MKTEKEIIEIMQCDLGSYQEFIDGGNIGNELIYWNAWFDGADWEDLENAEKGIIYKKPQSDENTI